MSDFISIGMMIFTAFMAMIPPTVAALAAFREARIIHSLVNSQLDAVKAELFAAKREIVALKQHVGVSDKPPASS